MSAEMLRQAAALMRERADLPYVKGEWESDGARVRRTSKSPRFSFPTHAESACCIYEAEDEKVVNEAIAKHLASWHPVVALAVADWLDRTAANYENGLYYPRVERDALTVARAYLGESA